MCHRMYMYEKGHTAFNRVCQVSRGREECAGNSAPIRYRVPHRCAAASAGGGGLERSASPSGTKMKHCEFTIAECENAPSFERKRTDYWLTKGAQVVGEIGSCGGRRR